MPAETIQAPSKYVFSHNPIVFDLSNFTDDYVYVKITEGFEVIAAKYQLRNGACKIDLSGFIKNLFTFFGFVDYSIFYNESDTMKTVQVEIYINYANPLYSENHYVIHGVTQILGKDTDVFVNNNELNKYLTGFDIPKYWHKYPFTVSLVSSVTNSFDNYVLIENNIGSHEEPCLALPAVSVRHISVSTMEDTSMVLLGKYLHLSVWEETGGAMRVTDILRVDIVKDHINDAVYLRWLNEFGGYDYYMFYRKDIKETSRTSYVNKYPDTLYKNKGVTKGTSKPFSKNVGEVYVIGANDVPRQEFNQLRKINRSPKVDLWIEGDATWLAVNVSDATWTIPQDEDVLDVEMTLLMPEIFTLC